MVTKNFFNLYDALKQMDEIQRDMGRYFTGTRPFGTRKYPAVNVWSNADKVNLTMELPGYDAGDLDVSLNNNLLTVKGERKPFELKNDQSYHRQERPYGIFARTLELPYEVDQEKIEAKLNKGILSLTLHRAESSKPKKICVKC